MSLFLSTNINTIEQNNILCYEKIKNNIMQNSYFYKLIYSDTTCTFNGIFFNFTLKDIYIEKYFNKIKCVISHNDNNKNIIKKILELEHKILNKFNQNYKDKTIIFRIQEQLKNMNIKLQNSTIKKFTVYKQINFLIKISGIWSSNDKNECGLTFKFFIINKKI
jgi:hypothetical protein